MHILFLSDNFSPEVNAPASRTFEHCREWVRAGNQVTVITCVPNFPKGKVFDGYRNKLWQREEMSGIEVIRVWSFITANEGFAKRVTDYVSFMISAAIAAVFVRRVDVVVGTSPQFFTACAAFAVGSYKRVPWVFELRDIWPESIKAVGAMKDSAVIRILEHIEMFLYRRASRIVTVTESFRRTLAHRGIEIAKIDVVTNGVDIKRFAPRPKDSELVRKLGLEGYFVAGYVGTHGMAHGLETLLYAARDLSVHPDSGDVRFLFLGDGARKATLMKMAREQNLSNVIFIDSVAKDQVPRYWSLLDVSVIHLRREALFNTVIPSKLFECMGMGIPVLHGVSGESADIVRNEGIGEVFEPENVKSLVTGLLSMKRDPIKLNKLRQQCIASARNYDRGTLATRMLRALETLTVKKGRVD